jgi:hypothetical protein
MSASFSGMPNKRSLPVQAALWLLVSGITVFVTIVAAKALMQTFDQDDFPEDLLIKVELLPVIFPVHMFTGALALLLIPLALLARRWPRWHRIAGRVAAVDVLIAGVTAFPVALIAPVTRWSAAGFTAQATVWLSLLALGIWNVRHGRVAEHRACMIMMAAIATGAIFFRVYLASWVVFAQARHFNLFYAFDAWIAWLLPLLAAFAWVRRADLKQGSGPRTIAR